MFGFVCIYYFSRKPNAGRSCSPRGRPTRKHVEVYYTAGFPAAAEFSAFSLAQ